jgi:hypothetical protein
MPFYARVVLAAALLAAVWPHDVLADKKTVCTITVNSPDEKEIFRSSLPQDDYQFVELVERGRPDWLASACSAGVRCDVLLISGHFDGGTEFYSDRLDVRESLPVAEMERASCSDSCPGLFSQLKEVYLFGCNTLNAEAMHSASAEIGRSLLRSGHSQADADRLTKILNERHAGSNRDRMRQIFKDVPVIYGFSGKAPLGRSAGPVLERYFQSGGGAEIASGRPSAKLLGLFAPVSMTLASGMTATDTQAAYRADVCRFSDDRQSIAQRVAFVHGLLGREMAEVRMFLDAIERYVVSLTDAQRHEPSVAQALDAIARDAAARTRYLDFVHDADLPAVRARMIALAQNLGWLTPAQRDAETTRLLQSMIADNTAGPAEVDLVCSLNVDGALSKYLQDLQVTSAQADKAAPAAMLACLGSEKGHARIVQALTSASDDDVQLAQVYLRHRPIADVNELRSVAAGIARMKDSAAQVRALDTLAALRLSDRQSLAEITRVFQSAKSVTVQRAVAGILIRSDYQELDRPELVATLRQARLKSSDGADLIDVLLRRLQTH